jgi:prepilin-type N-terminal cleavage/methylation domain-containing protein
MNLLEIFLNSKKVQKTLITKPGEEGFSLVELVVVIAVLAVLSAVAVPAFVGVTANARASAVKNGLVNGVKECVVRDADSQTTKYADVQSYAGNYSGYDLA